VGGSEGELLAGYFIILDDQHLKAMQQQQGLVRCVDEWVDTRQLMKRRIDGVKDNE